MLGGYGEEVRETARHRQSPVAGQGIRQPSLINVWVDPDAYAPGTMNQTMYK